MTTIENYEITGQISGNIISDSPIQHSENLALGIHRELGLLILAQETNNKTQNLAQKSIEIMLDDMSFNLSALSEKQKPTFRAVSTCLHESIENINDYLIEQGQFNSAELSHHGISLSSIQIHPLGISCSIHGDITCLKHSDDSLSSLGSKLSQSNRLGIHSGLSFSISEIEFKLGDILFLATSELIECLGHDFIRMTLSRFGDNLDMAIRQINARAKKLTNPSDISFLICKNNKHSTLKKGWFK